MTVFWNVALVSILKMLVNKVPELRFQVLTAVSTKMTVFSDA
jgi:hypothetical protein